MTRIALLALAVGCSHHPDVQPDAVPDAGVDSGIPGVIAVPLAGCSWSYTGTFDVGGAPFRLTIDTGSNVLGVAGRDCTECTAAGVRDEYTPSASAVDEHTPVTISYDVGEIGWSGELYSDDVSIGGHTGRLELASISTEMNFFANGTCGAPDGILGIAGTGPANLMTALAASGTPEVLALHECIATGTLWLGGYDPAVATASPAYAPMTVGVSSYSVPVVDFSVGGTSIGLPATRTARPSSIAAGRRSSCRPRRTARSRPRSRRARRSSRCSARCLGSRPEGAPART